MSIKDFKNPWAKGGKYYKQNALQNNVLESDDLSGVESGAFCSTGTIEFKDLTESDLAKFRVIPEEGSNFIIPTANSSYDGDGFYFKNWTHDKYWYKVSGGSSVTIYYKDGKIYTKADISSTCKFIAESLGKYYKVGWEPKTKPHNTKNPFDRE
ncbi:MAG: hypothetical protein GX437_07070 [Sphingobacteriales bacterium]|nr:hypothetical protein [Sphingobacteriales bacterium]